MNFNAAYAATPKVFFFQPLSPTAVTKTSPGYTLVITASYFQIAFSAQPAPGDAFTWSYIVIE